MLRALLQLIPIMALLSCSFSGKMPGRKQDQYYNHFNKITGYNGCSLYKFDSAGYVNFIQKEDMSNLVSIVYGYFLNDTLKVQPDLLKDPNPYCKTVVLNEIKKKLGESCKSGTPIKNDFIFTGHLINMKTNLKYMNNSNRKKLVVLYGQNGARIFKKFYPSFSKICLDNHFDLVVLSLDPIW